MNFHRQIIQSILVLLCLAWIGLRPALAQEVEVNSAEPPAAEQGTINLDVTIGGNGFERGAIVRFLVAGSENTGGIVVNSTKVKGPRKLIANIDIALDAVVDDFDIEVQLNGRKGKGTTLFAVQLIGTGNPGEGNQPLPGSADLLPGGDISSNWQLQGSFIDHGGEEAEFETLEGELTAGERLTVAGDAGAALGELGSSVLPPGALAFPTGCDQTAAADCEEVLFDSLTGLTWIIRLDHDKNPPDRVQLQFGWLNPVGNQHHLRIGWLVQGNLPSEDDYGDLTTLSSGGPCPPLTPSEPPCSLRDGQVHFIGDPFRIDGDMPVGKGKKRVQVVYSEYGQDGVTNTTINTEVFE